MSDETLRVERIRRKAEKIRFIERSWRSTLVALWGLAALAVAIAVYTLINGSNPGSATNTRDVLIFCGLFCVFTVFMYFLMLFIKGSIIKIVSGRDLGDL